VNGKTFQIPKYERMQETNPYRARGYKGERQIVTEMVRQHRTRWVTNYTECTVSQQYNIIGICKIA